MEHHPLELRNQTLRSSLRRRDERAKSPGRKTVSFCSRNTEKKVSNVSDCLKIMMQGTELVKLRANVRQFCRFFTLDSDHSWIRWTPTNKKPHKARISVESIKEVRMGRNTELLRATENSNADLQDECTFSIIYGASYEILDLIAMTPDDANIWVTGLMALTSTHKSEPENSMATVRERWIGSAFKAKDVENKGYISEKSAVRLICELNPRLTVSRVKQKVKEASALGLVDNNRGHIGLDEFVEIYKDISTRPEIYFLMVRYANKDYLSCEDLQIFLETEQGMIGVGRLFCEELIQQYEPSPEAKEKHCMTVDGFTAYLHAKTCTVFDPAHFSICQDMDRPFNEYFIAASYNTYLVEDQASGPSSIDGFITALKRNCRFIEMNLWDPLDESEPQEPLICRTATMISKITLSSALQTIKALAFERTRYPLFLRLDVRLSTEWQIRACEILHNILEDKLYQPQLDTTDWSDPANIPTPTHLLGKIILVSTGYKSRSSELPPSNDVTTGEDEEEAKKQQRLCTQLLDLIPSFGELRYIRDNISYADLGTLCAHRDIFSICESSCLKLIQNNASIFGHIGRNFLLRVTPNITRVDSSNMNPQEFWNFGTNLCAMNYQTPGLMMDLQEGKFLANGGCGYVLKPKIMNDDVFSPVDKMPFTPQVLHLRIMSAQQLPRPRGSNAKGDSTDAFVVVEVFGIPTDCAEERTKTVRNDNSPKFDESFQFEVCIPEIALVRFLVLDDEYVGDDFIGQFTIPFDCLQSGYRHIQLLNNEGEPLENATLFVHVAITNRRGGGKPKKRGLSVKRKQNHIQTGMKLIGIKAADDLFKAISDSLVEAIETRNKLETALTKWQELCGIGPTSSMRAGLRLLHARIISAAAEASPTSLTKPENSSPIWIEQQRPDQKLSICVQIELPESVQKCVASLEQLLSHCAQAEAMNEIIEKMSDSTNKISDFYVELPQVCEENGLHGQKSQRAIENVAWNVRLLKAQFILASKTQTEAKEIIQQLVETAKSLNAFRERGDDQVKV